jgi:hypothetical protein
MGGPFHASSEYYTSFEAAMRCDSFESMIQASREELMKIKAWLELPFLGF